MTTPAPTALSNAYSPSIPRSGSAVRLRPIGPTKETHHASGRQSKEKENVNPDAKAPDVSHARTTASPLASSLTAPLISAALTAHTDPPWHLSSAFAPSSLDSYLALQNAQSTSGLEVVYGLKVELSKLYEELLDRKPEQSEWGHPLPYRVMGVGGVLYWQARREEQERRRDRGTPEEKQAEAALQAEPSDPFGTVLPTQARPPPPVSPDTILPAFVLLDRLRTGMRRALGDFEDQLETKNQQIVALLENEERLRLQIEELSDTAAIDVPPASSGVSEGKKHRRGKARSVHYADDYVSTAILNRPSSSHGGSPLSPLSPRGRSKSPRKPVPGIAFGATAEAIFHRSASNSLSSRIHNLHHPLDSSRSTHRTANDANLNTAREEALERSIAALEAALENHRSTEARLRDRLEAQAKTHSSEVIELTSKLSHIQSQLTQREVELTHKNVLLNLESIARRQREERKLKLEDHFAHEIHECEKELRVLLDPAKDLLFVRKAPASEPVIHIVEKGSTTALEKGSKTQRGTSSASREVGPGGGGGAIPKSSKSARKKITSIGGFPDVVIDQSMQEAKENSDMQRSGDSAAAPDAPLSPSDSLYPSPLSPLAMVESSVRSPAAKQWLGKLLSPITDSATEKEKSLTSPIKDSSILHGHLFPGVDLLATDLLLTLDAFFQLELQFFTRASIELSQTLKFDSDLTKQHRIIAEGTERPDLYIDEPMKATTKQGDQSELTPQELSSLLASIPPSSLHYLQSIQKLFLALYHRLPFSLQQRFIDLSSRMNAVAWLNQRDERTQHGVNMAIGGGIETKPDGPSDVGTTRDADHISESATTSMHAESHRASPSHAASSIVLSLLPALSPFSSPLLAGSSNHALARLELILSKVQAIARFRGVTLIH